MKVVVLDGNENQAVACTRSLARAGHHVIVGSSASWSKAGWSRGCRESFRYAPPEHGSVPFVDAIVSAVERAGGAIVLPMTERTTLPLSRYRGDVEAAGGRLILPPHATVLRAFDKSETKRIAQSVGVAVPRTTVLETLAQARDLAGSADYPIVLKPRQSEEVDASGRVIATGAPIYASDPAQLLTAYDILRKGASAVLAQEFVPGVGCGYFVLMRGGELRAEFAHRRIRDVRPTGSGSAVRESVEPAPKLRTAGLAILRALGWHGVAMVEFRVRSDGTPVFLEVNGRFWNSLALAIHAGVDFPALLVEIALRGDVSPVLNYRLGARCRWLLGDFRHLVEVWRGAPAGYPETFPSRMRTLMEFLTPVTGTYHDNFAMDDPLPEIGDWIDFLTRRIPASRRRHRSPMPVLNAERRAARS